MVPALATTLVVVCSCGTVGGSSSSSSQLPSSLSIYISLYV